MQAGLDYVPGHSHADGKFDEADAEVIKSYLRYTIVSSYATYLPPADFAEVMVPLFTDLYGIKQRPVRWKKCYHSTSSVMAGHVSQLYVDKYFPHENRAAALRRIGRHFRCSTLKSQASMAPEVSLSRPSPPMPSQTQHPLTLTLSP